MKKQKFLIFLIDEFNRRKTINSRYSLRAFAKHLNIAPSLLSRMLRGKIVLTEDVLDKFTNPLSITPSDYQVFYDEIQSLKKKRTGKIDSGKIHQISAEEFNIVQDWHFFVILELTQLNDFKLTPGNISKKIGITTEKAKEALDTLINNGHLSTDENGNLVPTFEYTSTLSNQFTNVALKLRQKQILSRAIESMDIVDLDFRDQGAMTIAVDSDLLPEIKTQIKNFRRNLANLIETKSKKIDHVYELSTSFFPWTNQ